MTSFSSYVKNAIAALATAGALTLGSVSPNYAAGGRPSGVSYSQSAGNGRDSGPYQAYLQSYVDTLEQTYGNLLHHEESKKNSGYSYYDAYNAYLAAHERYVAALAGKSDKLKTYALMPTRLANGGIQYTDIHGSGYLIVTPQSNGELAYFGTEDVISRLLGRSELDRVGPKMKNGLFSDD